MRRGGSLLKPPPCGGKSLIPRHLIRPNKKDFDDEEFVVFHNVLRYRETRHIGAFAECRAGLVICHFRPIPTVEMAGIIAVL